MKKITMVVTLLLLIFGAITAQKRVVTQRRPAVKQVQVTARTLSRQPAGKAYTLNLTRKGTIYTLDSGVDYNRVRVNTSKGAMTIAELIQKSGKNISGVVSVGMTSDIRAQRFGGRVGRPGGGGLNFDCSGLACSCSGEDDCIDLFNTDNCGPIAVCYPDGCVCLRI
jgi:hypothetical protein